MTLDNLDLRHLPESKFRNSLGISQDFADFGANSG